MTRIQKLLVANRAEIVRRVARTCRTLGIATVAVYSDPDENEPFVADTDEAVRLPGSSAAETYLRGDLIIDAALLTGADAVHPGYGFLAENAEFARDCASAGLTFIGPSPAAIAAMGSKLEAKAMMDGAGISVLPSIEVPPPDAQEDMKLAAERIGYPVLVKASSGGGGKGMRTVRDPNNLAHAVASARRESAAAFGDDTIFLEPYLENIRHVEIQITGDAAGTIVHLFERECSIQRRHQKIIEESPSPGVGAELRERMGKAAVAAAKAVAYEGAGTVEFLLDGDDFFFLEMNTRIQVEHPVTEMVTGLDIVALQISIAEGKPLPETATDARITGHAIEARIYAEDPANGFLPVPGPLHRLSMPPSVRTDAGPGDGSEISVHYDPMIAKVIAHAGTREQAAAKLAEALAAAEIYGPTTNRELLVRVLRSDEFLAGRTDTAFLDRLDPIELSKPLTVDHTIHALAATIAGQDQRRRAAAALRSIPSGWRNAPSQLNVQEWESATGAVRVAYRFGRDGLRAEIDGSPMPAVVHSASSAVVDLTAGGIRREYRVHAVGRNLWVTSPMGQSALIRTSRFPAPAVDDTPGSLLSPMPGKVIEIVAGEGDKVARGAIVVVIEAMKMEHSIRAPVDGIVSSIPVILGEQVQADQILAVVDAESASR